MLSRNKGRLNENVLDIVRNKAKRVAELYDPWDGTAPLKHGDYVSYNGRKGQVQLPAGSPPVTVGGNGWEGWVTVRLWDGSRRIGDVAAFSNELKPFVKGVTQESLAEGYTRTDRSGTVEKLSDEEAIRLVGDFYQVDDETAARMLSTRVVSAGRWEYRKENHNIGGRDQSINEGYAYYRGYDIQSFDETNELFITKDGKVMWKGTGSIDTGKRVVDDHTINADSAFLARAGDAAWEAMEATHGTTRLSERHDGPNEKSPGHICFSGDVEYYDRNGEVFRADRSNVFDVMTDCRIGRWECSRAQFDKFIAPSLSKTESIQEDVNYYPALDGKTGYFKGSLVKFTGNSEYIYHGMFYEAIYQEGPDYGKTCVVSGRLAKMYVDWLEA